MESDGSLVLEIVHLRRERKFPQIVEMLYRPDGEFENVFDNPELFLSLATAFTWLYQYDKAREILERRKDFVTELADAQFQRRWTMLYVIQLVHRGLLSEAKYWSLNLLSETLAEGDERHAAWVHNILGQVAAIRGQPTEAITSFGRSILAARKTGLPDTVAAGHYNCAMTLRENGRPVEAAVHLHYAESYFERHGVLEETIVTSAERALVEFDLGEQKLAVYLAEMALAAANDTQSGLVRVAALRALGSILFSLNEREKGLRLLSEAVAESEAYGNRPTEAELASEYAQMLQEAGLKQKAAPFYHRAVELYTLMGATERNTVLEEKQVSS